MSLCYSQWKCWCRDNWCYSWDNYKCYSRVHWYDCCARGTFGNNCEGQDPTWPWWWYVHSRFPLLPLHKFSSFLARLIKTPMFHACMRCFLIRWGRVMIHCSQCWRNVCQEEGLVFQPSISWVILNWISKTHSCLSFPIQNAKAASFTLRRLWLVKWTNVDSNKNSGLYYQKAVSIITQPNKKHVNKSIFSHLAYFVFCFNLSAGYLSNPTENWLLATEASF